MVAFVEFPCAASVLLVVQKTGLLFFPMHQISPPLVEHTSNQFGADGIITCVFSLLAAAPATTPASDKMLDLSREVMDTSMAAGLSLVDQLGISISAGLVSLLS